MSGLKKIITITNLSYMTKELKGGIQDIKIVTIKSEKLELKIGPYGPEFIWHFGT